MALIRWEPARELSTIQSEMNRLFNTFFDTPTNGASAGTAARRWVPAMDLVENEGEFVLRADLPGLTKDQVQIELDDNVLTISGERRARHTEKREGYYRLERGYGEFRRSLTLPDGVSAERISAEFSNGVLEIRVPKPESRKPQKVQISVGGTEAEPEMPAIDAAESASFASKSEATVGV